MEIDGKFLTVKAQSWIREDSCIKVPHPVSQRLIFLTREQADVFEKIDYGCDIDEIIEEITETYTDFSEKKLYNIVNLLQKLELVVIADQFD